LRVLKVRPTFGCNRARVALLLQYRERQTCRARKAFVALADTSSTLSISIAIFVALCSGDTASQY